MKLSDEQLRGLVNASQLYDTWRDVMAPLTQMPGGMYWRVINSKEYLYQYATAAGKQQTKYVGPRTPAIEEKYRDFKQTKEDLEERRRGTENRINELAPAWRALRLPAIDSTAGRILRAFDLDRSVRQNLLVIGTYALKAYEVEAAVAFAAGMDATEDLDFTLTFGTSEADPDLPRRLLLVLKEVDSSFIVAPSSARTAVNKSGYRVDLLVSAADSRAMAAARPWKPEALEGQEWLALGNPVNSVVIDYQGWPVAFSAPDPRYFALHKLWLSKRRGRPATKAAKDRNQGEALLKIVREAMPRYPMGRDFVSGLPGPLKAHAGSKEDK